LKIKQIEAYHVALAYREPFVIASPSNVKRPNAIKKLAKWLLFETPVKRAVRIKSQNIVVRIVTDEGVQGYGASSPPRMVTGETVGTVLNALDLIAPRLIGMCPLEIEKNVELMDRTLAGNPSAKAAIDIALHDIQGNAAGKPLCLLLGGARTEVLTDKSLGIRSPKKMADDAIRAVDQGFRVIKAKLGANPTQDIERIKLIREAVGDAIQLRIDANQGWTTQQAIEVLRKIAKYDIQFAEQPVLAEDLEGLIEVHKSSPIPVMADESLHSPKDARRMIQAGAVDFMNIKLMKSGGIFRSREIATIAEAAGVKCMVGSGAESGIGIAAATHLAAGVKNIHYADLDSDLLLKDALVKKGGTAIMNSMRIPSKGSGLGIEEVNEKLLKTPTKVFRQHAD